VALAFPSVNLVVCQWPPSRAGIPAEAGSRAQRSLQSGASHSSTPRPGMSTNKVPELWIPKTVAEMVHKARPVCRFFGTQNGCKKGKKCPNMHGSVGSLINLPHISRHSGGLTLRPPLKLAWIAFCEQIGLHNNSTSLIRYVKPTSGAEEFMIQYLQNMRPPRDDLIHPARLRGGIEDSQRNWHHICFIQGGSGSWFCLRGGLS
jgi:hypothetical protein